MLLLLDSSGNIAIVRICSTTPVRLLHGLVLLPSGISGKMTVTLDLTTIIAMLVASFYRYAALPIFCSSSLVDRNRKCYDNAIDVVICLHDPTDPSTKRTAPPSSAHV